jgi:DNA polymerase III alpha subunit
MLDFKKIPHDDERTYFLLGNGLTKGVFQLEKPLGQRYCNIVKPRNIFDIADVISIIRPGSRESKHVDGKTSMSDAYCAIRNKQYMLDGLPANPSDERLYHHENLMPILKPTQSILIYQEQIMQICNQMAGMSLKEADMVRKAVGKKKSEYSEPYKKPFLEGCHDNGYSKELGEQLWEWIVLASGYLFNKSHAIAYATIAYKTAYAKAHYPLQFYTAMLKFSHKKADTYEEAEELINDAKLFDINVIPPKISRSNRDFEIIDKNTISYGVEHIKGIGASAIKAIKRAAGVKTWEEFLVAQDRFKISKDNVEALIKSGVLDEFALPRTYMLAEYGLLRSLTSNEQAIVLSLVSAQLHPNILIDIDGSDFSIKRTVTKYTKLSKFGLFDICGMYGPLKEILPSNDEPLQGPFDLEHAVQLLATTEVANKARRERIKAVLGEYRRDGPYEPDFTLYALWEKFYFGISLTASTNQVVTSESVIKCIEVYNIRGNEQFKLAGVIQDVTVKTTKTGQSKGKPMAFIDLADGSYILKGILCFASFFEEYQDLLRPGNAVIIYGKKMRDGNGVMLQKVKNL